MTNPADDLRFLNLSPNSALNALSKAEVDSIWLPEIFLPNKEPEQPLLEQIVAAQTTAMLTAPATLSPASYLYIANVSEGGKTPLLWTKEFK
jgi:hypothetical protein